MRWVMTYIESLARYEFLWDAFSHFLFCIDTWKVLELALFIATYRFFDCKHVVGWSDMRSDLAAAICMSAPKHVRTRRVPPRLPVNLIPLISNSAELEILQVHHCQLLLYSPAP